MSRTSYDAAFSIIQSQSEMCDKLASVGLSFEYGSGAVGKFLEGLLNESDSIIKDVLGLHDVSKRVVTTICGAEQRINLEVLYTDEESEQWRITEDDFCEFLYAAAKSTHVQDLMWKAMVDRDVSAKEEFNKLKCGTIGPLPGVVEK